MKKTILQMLTTVAVLWVVFASQAGGRDGASPTFHAVLSPQPETQSIALPILMYHSLLKDSARAGPYVLSPEVFRQDLLYLRAKGYETVTISDLLAYVQHGTPLPSKPVMITFDDGHYNNYVYAYPLLKELHMRAVLSVIGSQTALFTESGQENTYWSYLNASRLLEMAQSGIFEIENHSYDLHSYGARHGCVRIRGENRATYETLLHADTQQVQSLLTASGLPTPKCYTYPFGSFSKESENILREMGFSCTLSCTKGINHITRDPECLFRMKRFNRPSGISTEAFMSKIGV